MPSDGSSTELFAPGAEEYYRKVLGLPPKGQEEPPEALDGLCRCGHPRKRHLEPPGAQCVACPGDDGRSWRHEFTPEEEVCSACGHTEGEGCGCPAHAFVSEEHCHRCAGTAAIKAEYERIHGKTEAAKPPPQPERRPPRLIAYSVQGHLYEVALPGDATVVAQDGALIITHALGPVAGIVQAGPLEGEQS